MEKTNKVLTVVVPTYNMEKYLNRCLDSLIVSDEQMQQLEVLVINDGSKDSSSQIAHEYQDRYPDTFRVIDKENGNYGSCINRGLAEATGKYIKVLDADDWFDNGNLVLFLKKLTEFEADLFITNFQIVNEKNTITRSVSYDYPPNKKLSIDFLCEMQSFRSLNMHSVTYNAENLRLIGYKQSEGISYTDQEWMFLPMSTVHTVVYLDLFIYQYLVGREGQTMMPEVLKKSIGHTIKGVFVMIEEFEKVKGDKNAVYFEGRILHRLEYIYKTSLVEKRGLETDELIKFDSHLRKISLYFYECAGLKNIHQHFAFQYVNWWRRNGYKKIPTSVLMYNKFLEKIVGIKTRLLS